MGRFEMLLREIKLVGEVIGAQERASELVHYFKKNIEKGEPLFSIPEDLLQKELEGFIQILQEGIGQKRRKK